MTSESTAGAREKKNLCDLCVLCGKFLTRRFPNDARRAKPFRMDSIRELIILKTGSTLPNLLARKGDFTDWIAAGLDAGSAAVRIVDAENGDALPAYDDVAGVVITGSHDMVTERQPWSERAAAWLPGLVERGIPTLGICYGHQLLAHAVAGRSATTRTAGSSARSRSI